MKIRRVSRPEAAALRSRVRARASARGQARARAMEVRRLAPPPPSPERVLELYLGSLEPPTDSVYLCEIRAFARFLGVEPPEAARRLLRGPSEAAKLMEQWAAASLREGRAKSSVARRRAVLRGLVRKAEMLGAVAWDLG